ncbi:MULTISPECIES: hypothetical protein [unclassified Picosynechococcus]|uniref:hypothetical protein n=1 Tax=unclassified Picosynechococcus TaxID=3079910 RepID=UPI0004AA1DFC|nr:MULTISPECIES: hypothetical protein [unclassified Picosynechococcus]ANV89578.1 hypothetical protein AWQ24_02410 [Picosynechococcus sp. PCC 8807]QCS49088.1 hypothetical protein FEK30_06390 [Picosynechococcus sp. PCC 11901]
MTTTLFTAPRTLLQMIATGAVFVSGFSANALPTTASPLTVSPAQDATSLFFEDYTWCDAKMLGEFWGEGPGNAKVSAGKLLQDGDYQTVESKLTAARDYYGGQGLCNYTDEGFSYEDMVVVAEYWDVSVTEAKTTIADKLEWGLPGVAHDIVEMAYAEQSHYDPTAIVETIAFENLNRDGHTLGYFVQRADGLWVELTAAGEEIFYFNEIERDPLVVTLFDASRNMEIHLDYHFNQIQYRYSSDPGAPQPLYAMGF